MNIEERIEKVLGFDNKVQWWFNGQDLVDNNVEDNPVIDVRSAETGEILHGDAPTVATLEREDFFENGCFLEMAGNNVMLFAQILKDLIDYGHKVEKFKKHSDVLEIIRRKT
jgi:hypothetical protein